MDNLIILEMLKEGLKNQLLVLKNKNHEVLLSGLETNSNLLRQSFLFISNYENHNIFKVNCADEFIKKLNNFYKDINKFSFEKKYLSSIEIDFLSSFKVILDALKMRLYKMVKNYHE